MARRKGSRKAAAMTPKILSRRSPRHALVDEAMERYVEWRQECAAVEDAYTNWSSAPARDAELPYAAYGAALDREQSAAALYGRALVRLERVQ
jgi:hypothetical protein